MLKPMHEFVVDNLRVRVFRNRKETGSAAGLAVSEKIRARQKMAGDIRMVFAAAPSQNEFLAALTGIEGIEWGKVTAFHMDEYLGLPEDAPQLFGNYLRQHIFQKARLKEIHFIDSAPTNPSRECERYAGLLRTAPIDIVGAGIGENGHLAFNDPPVADFDDQETVKIVELDEKCRQQQVNDGCFRVMADVPKQAITMTVPALMSADSLIVTVPGPTKTEAVFSALKGPIETACPASILRRHKDAQLFLDMDSAARIM